jgi:hypothetical protein
LTSHKRPNNLTENFKFFKAHEMKEKVFTIDNIYFIIAIAILTLWLTFVSAKGGLTNHTYTRQWWKRITQRGLIAGFILIVLGSVLVFQEINNGKIADNNKIDLQNEQNLRAQKITKGVNLGVTRETEKIFKSLSEAFKKQGLQFDIIKNQVIKLRDSVKVTNNYGETPLLTLKSLKIIDSTYFGNKTYKVEYEIFSQDSKSLNVDVKFDVFTITTNGEIRTLVRNFAPLSKGEIIGKEKGLRNFFSIPKDDPYYKDYAFRLKGSYNSSKSDKYYIDKFYLLKPRVKKDNFGSPVQAYEDLLRAHLIKFQLN